MKIRKATRKDLSAISKIFRIETAKKPYFQEWTKKTASEKVNTAFKNDDIYAAILKNKIIGFIICQKNKKKKQVYVDEMWLMAHFQGEGIGSTIMKYVEEHYKKRGFAAITLMANRKAKAVDFYKKLGYKAKHEFFYMIKKIR